MARDTNLVVVEGRIAREDAKSINGWTTFTLGVGESYKKKDGTYENITSYFDVKKYGSDGFEKFVKGAKVAVVGSLRQEKWEAKDGTKKSVIRIMANNIVCEGSVSQPSGSYPRPNSAAGGQSISAEEFENGDDIPF